MLKAITLGLAGQQEQMKNRASACLSTPVQHSQDRWEGNTGSWKLVPVFHKLLASTWQLLFSPSYCYLHALLKHLSPLIDLCQICFI